MELKLKIDYDLADTITRNNLADLYRMNESEVESLEARAEEEGDAFPDYKKIDLHDARQHMKMLASVLAYMNTKKDLEPLGLDHLAKW